LGLSVHQELRLLAFVGDAQFPSAWRVDPCLPVDHVRFDFHRLAARPVLDAMILLLERNGRFVVLTFDRSNIVDEADMANKNAVIVERPAARMSARLIVLPLRSLTV
jgi:hypothetical protein